MSDATVTLVGPLADRGSWTATNCLVDRAMSLVGNRTTVLILREAFYGTTRFSDFASRVGISEPVAASRLRELVDDGLLVKEPYRRVGERTRSLYRLTDKGAELFPLLVALQQWGERWLAGEESGVRNTHHGCGSSVRAELRCEVGHHVTVADVDVVRRPASALDIGG